MRWPVEMSNTSTESKKVSLRLNPPTTRALCSSMATAPCLYRPVCNLAVFHFVFVVAIVDFLITTAEGSGRMPTGHHRSHWERGREKGGRRREVSLHFRVERAHVFCSRLISERKRREAQNQQSCCDRVVFPDSLIAWMSDSEFAVNGCNDYSGSLRMKSKND